MQHDSMSLRIVLIEYGPVKLFKVIFYMHLLVCGVITSAEKRLSLLQGKTALALNCILIKKTGVL